MSLSAVVFAVILTIAVSSASKCLPILERGLVEQDVILNSLTQIRNMIENGEFNNPLPKKPLKKLVYDLELEQHAKAYIDDCNSSVDEDKHKGLGYSKITIRQADTTTYPWHYIISTKFVLRGINYNFSDPLNIENEYYTNQFLQLINAETDRVGCDYGLYYNKTAYERPFTNSFICFFAPAYIPHTLPYEMFKHDEPVNPDINEESNSNYHPAKLIIKCEL